MFFGEMWLKEKIQFFANRPSDGDDEGVVRVEQAIEDTYAFPLLRGKDVKRWAATPSIYILLPHTQHDAANAVELADLPKKTREYFVKFKDKLSSRKKFRNFDPSGKIFYGLYSVLAATFAPFKVVWREMAGGAIAAVVASAMLPSGTEKIVIPDHKLFIIPCKSRAEADFVAGMFNSTLSTYLIRSYAISTGISAHVLERLPIPEYDDTNSVHSQISQSAKECGDLVAKGLSVEDAEAKLDKLVGKLLRVTEAELAVIQEALDEIANKPLPIEAIA